MNHLQRATVSFGATLATIGLVLIAATPAHAATIRFQSGATFQNQTIFSSSASKVGANSIEDADFANSYIATLGFGEIGSDYNATITHTRVSAQSYCRWRLITADPDPGNLNLTCNYFS
jgi:hypothetical protein